MIISMTSLAIALAAQAGGPGEVATVTPPPIVHAPPAPSMDYARPAPPPPPPPMPLHPRRAQIIKGSILDTDYPTPAIYARAEGTTVVSLRISKVGLPQNCAVSQSSGWITLDRITCNIIVTRFRFRPATDGAGKNVEEIRTQRVAWRAPWGSTPEFAQFVATVGVDETGRVTSCVPRVAEAAADDPCATLSKRRFAIKADASGQAIAYSLGATLHEP